MPNSDEKPVIPLSQSRLDIPILLDDLIVTWIRRYQDLKRISPDLCGDAKTVARTEMETLARCIHEFHTVLDTVKPKQL